MATATLSSRSKPPKQEARKSTPINIEYEDKAKALLRGTMQIKRVDVEELASRLNKMGVEISTGGVANKISRGGFSAAFFLQCMVALGASWAEELE